jgi:hypothetical protein
MCGERPSKVSSKLYIGFSPAMATITPSLHLILSNKIILSGPPLGQGGYGIVYKGVWSTTSVAKKKLLLQNLSTELKIEFEKECTRMLELGHPNIVQLLGVCMDSEYAIVTEFAPDGNLFNLLHSQKPIGWPAGANE